MSELPPGWAWTTLGETVRWGSGGTPRRSVTRYYGGSIPWAIIGDLNDEVVSTTATTITDEGLAESSARLVQPGTVLVALYGSIGKLGIAGTEMATNQAIAFADPRPGLDSKFLFWYLRAQRRDLAHAGKGATQKNISQTVLRSWPLPLPPLNEQRRIVAAIEEHLSRLDAADASLSTAGVRLGMLDERLDTAVLNGWNTDFLGAICPIFVDCPHRTPKYQAVGIPALRPRDVVGGRLQLDSAARVDRSEFEIQTKRRIPAAGDVVYSRELSFGWAVVVPSDTELCLSQGMVLIRPDDSMLPEFLARVLNSSIGRTQAEAAATGSAHPHINLRDIRAYQLPVPPLEEQRRIVQEVEERLSRIDALRASIERAQRRSQTLRTAILERAFRGELVPQDPADEPAETLLARIRAERLHPVR